MAAVLNGMSIDSFGIKYWRLNGLHHREDGPAIEYPDGRRQWLQYGNFHRVDGPAIEWGDGDETWYLHGKMHREDGPAWIRPYGNKEIWYLNGNRVPCSNQEEFERLMKLKAFW